MLELIAIPGMKCIAYCYTFSEALCSLLYMERIFMLISIHGMKLYAHSYTWSEALCSLLRME